MKNYLEYSEYISGEKKVRKIYYTAADWLIQEIHHLVVMQYSEYSSTYLLPSPWLTQVVNSSTEYQLLSRDTHYSEYLFKEYTHKYHK